MTYVRARGEKSRRDNPDLEDLGAKIPNKPKPKKPRRKKRDQVNLTRPNQRGQATVEITLDFIDKWRTPAGAWTRRQLAILGVSWPPKAGWRDRVKGRWITQDDADEFIAARLKGKRKTEPESVVIDLPDDPRGHPGPFPPGVILWGHCKGQTIASQSDEALQGAIWAAERGVGDDHYRMELAREADRRLGVPPADPSDIPFEV